VSLMDKKKNGEKIKKPKIRVEFEMSPEDVKRLLSNGKKKSSKISDEELSRLGKEGAIKASDYLDNTQASFASRAASGWISEISDKVSDELSELSDQIHNPEVQEAAAFTVEVALVAAKRRTKESTEKRPKE
jgi:hypothetical protein